MTGAVVAGRFVLEREAGAGGMGTVYRTRDLVGGGTVALKLLGGAGPRDAERFAREAAILADLVHPHVVRHVAHGVAPDGRHYLAMEWLEGQHLAARVEARPLDVVETIEVLRHAADALAFAHARQIVHRDVKPENLFLPDGDVGRLKLLDFGIARLGAGARRLTQTGTIVGTPGYLAPEIIKGARDVDARADVFALGCVAFFCLSGRSPFEADDVAATLARILLDDAPRLAIAVAGVPPALSDLVAAMLSRDPAARPGDGAELLSRLDALPSLLHGPRPPAQPLRSQRLTRREQRIACVVMARAAPSDAEPLARELAPLGAALCVLPDGALVLTPPPAKATDQAALAARAALAIVSRDAGAAVSVCTGSGQFSAETPLGGVIDRAAERLARVPRGRIGLDEVTAALLEGRFEVDRVAGGAGAGTGTGAGAGMAVEAFLRAPRPEIEPRRSLLGKPTPFVGRARELGLLTGTFITSTSEDIACAVVVTGAPGSGKSRLRQELLDWVAGRAERAEILLGAGDPLATGSPFAALGHALRRAAGITEGDDADERRRKLAARLGRALAPADRMRVVGFLGELAGIPFSDEHDPSLRAARGNPQLMSDGMRRAWEDWLAAECAAQPVLLVLDDLQWGDAGSIAFVDLALRHLKNAPFLVMGFGRPELETAFPALWAAREPQTLRLGPLSRKAAELLIRDSLGADVAPGLVAALGDRADGNPFFLEELIRAAHAGRTDGSLPDSVLGIVQARLDAEGTVAKRILRAASVFGDRFSRAGLHALLGSEREDEDLGGWLVRLVERELVCPLPGATGAGGDLYTFGHGLVREAAYAMLTPDDRALGHRLAGLHLEATPFCDPMIVAEHFRRGGRPDRAARWYDRAAAVALGANQLGAAIERATLGLESLELASTAGDGPGNDRGGFGLSPSELAGTLHLTRAEAHVWRGEYTAAATHATAATARLPAGSALALRAATQGIIAAGKQGRLDVVEAEVALVCQLWLIDPAARDAFITCLAFAATFLMFGGRFTAADPLLGLLDDMVGDGTDVDPQAVALCHQARSIRASVHGDLGACLAAIQAALGAFERAGDLRNACTARANLGFVYTELGDPAGAERVLREALGAARRMELAEAAATILHNLGRAVGLRGDAAEAEQIERQALESLERQGEPRLSGLARVYLAEILVAAGRAGEAEAEATRAATVLDIAPALRVRALAGLAHARAASGKVTEAMEAATRARDGLETLGSVEEGEAAIRLCHAECLERAGLRPEARAAIRDARDRLLARAMRIASDEWRRRFLDDVPENARTLRLARDWS